MGVIPPNMTAIPPNMTAIPPDTTAIPPDTTVTVPSESPNMTVTYVMAPPVHELFELPEYDGTSDSAHRLVSHHLKRFGLHIDMRFVETGSNESEKSEAVALRKEDDPDSFFQAAVHLHLSEAFLDTSGTPSSRMSHITNILSFNILQL
jgi:hypothetical protein